jgi:hypothetical protein
MNQTNWTLAKCKRFLEEQRIRNLFMMWFLLFVYIMFMTAHINTYDPDMAGRVVISLLAATPALIFIFLYNIIFLDDIVAEENMCNTCIKWALQEGKINKILVRHDCVRYFTNFIDLIEREKFFSDYAFLISEIENSDDVILSISPLIDQSKFGNFMAGFMCDFITKKYQ